MGYNRISKPKVKHPQSFHFEKKFKLNIKLTMVPCPPNYQKIFYIVTIVAPEPKNDNLCYKICWHKLFYLPVGKQVGFRVTA